MVRSNKPRVDVIQKCRVPEFMGETVAESEAWLYTVVAILGDGFHPDTRGDDYIDARSGQRTFSVDEADALDRGLERLFRLVADPYALAAAVVARWAAGEL